LTFLTNSLPSTLKVSVLTVVLALVLVDII
jgi:hypothetical protein